jgi:hypothetical protein
MTPIDMRMMTDILRRHDLLSSIVEDDPNVVFEMELAGSTTQEAAENIVNAILGNILSAHEKRMASLPRSVLNTISDDVCAVKARLVSKIKACFDERRLIDPQVARDIVEEITAEIQRVRRARGY